MVAEGDKKKKERNRHEQVGLVCLNAFRRKRVEEEAPRIPIVEPIGEM